MAAAFCALLAQVGDHIRVNKSKTRRVYLQYMIDNSYIITFCLTVLILARIHRDVKSILYLF